MSRFLPGLLVAGVNDDGTVTVTEMHALRSFLVDQNWTVARTFAKHAPAVTMTWSERRRFQQDNCIGLELDRTRTPLTETLTLAYITCGADPAWKLSLDGEKGTLRYDGGQLDVVRATTADGRTLTLRDAATGVTVSAVFDAKGEVRAESLESRIGGTKVTVAAGAFGLPGAPLPQ